MPNRMCAVVDAMVWLGLEIGAVTDCMQTVSLPGRGWQAPLVFTRVVVLTA